MEGEESDYKLHEAVFNGDAHRLATLLRSCNVAEKDKHGNTALHLAVMLGRHDCVQLLLNHGAPLRVSNLAGWNPLAEAVSYGHRPTLVSLVSEQQVQELRLLRAVKVKVVAALMEMEDFYMEVKWEFQCWMPFLSRMLPSDVCRIHKRGTKLRFDTTIVDYKNANWERGDLTFIFDGSQTNSLAVVDNILRVFHRVQLESTIANVDEQVDLLMSTETVSTRMSTSTMTFARARTGWFSREDRIAQVGGYSADVYDMTGAELELRTRNEHLTPEDLKNKNWIAETMLQGGMPQLYDLNGEPIHRPSLYPPPAPNVTWASYITSDTCPVLGRPFRTTKLTKSFKGTVAMTKDFPFTVDKLLSILAVVASVERFAKLREFVRMRLPPGFPISVDIPIVPTVTANVTFQEFSFRSDIPEEAFVVPEDYVDIGGSR